MRLPAMSKHPMAASLLLAILIPVASAQESATEKPAPEAPAAEEPAAPEAPAVAEEGDSKELNDKASYIIGRNIGENLLADGLELNIENFVTGLKEAMEGKESSIPAAEMDEIMMAFQEMYEAKMAAKAAAEGKANAEAGAKFLAENKKREEVTVTESGLHYEVLKAGEGAKPGLTDTVSVHYHGTLIDGSVFDSSVDRGVPAEFQVGGVIKGWTEALQLMPVGSKWKITVPSELAYGARGAGPDIGPNSVLIFEVELLEIKEQG